MAKSLTKKEMQQRIAALMKKEPDAAEEAYWIMRGFDRLPKKLRDYLNEKDIKQLDVIFSLAAQGISADFIILSCERGRIK